MTKAKRSRSPLLSALLAVLVAALAGGCGEGLAGAPPSRPAPPPAASAASPAFVLWESNRGGPYRIWRAELPGEAPRQLSPDEPGRDHCCAKISPDGRRYVYLSLPSGAGRYRPDVGVLRLADVDGGRDRALAPAARHYGEHRAAVWWGIDELVHLDGDGAAVRLRLSTGGADRLVGPGGRPGEGWLIAPGGRIATGNTPTFSDVDPAGGVRERPSLGGCQPSFSSDGALAVWSAGAGGPIDAIDLATRVTRTLVRKNDPRLPSGRSYVYFPALSADLSLLALAGSDGEHDHFAADYDIVVFELDPATLEPAGDGVVVAAHPAVDRYPDPFRAPPSPSQRPSFADRPADVAVDGARVRALVLTWDDGDAANRAASSDPVPIPRPRGLAWFDRRRAMALGGGSFETDSAVGERLTADLRATNQLTLALRFEPADLRQSGTLMALSGGGRRRLFRLAQSGRSLELTLRTSDTERGGRSVSVAELDTGGAHHLVLAFSPGRLAVFLDGVAAPTVALPGDFFAWRPAPLGFGVEPGEASVWRGAISDVAIWSRPLSSAEAQDEARRAARRADAAAVDRLVVEARVERVSPAPALASISPYREALAVDELVIVRRIAGPELAGERLRRVRWAILDGVVLPAPRPGDGARLVLEPFTSQPQLEPFYLADELDGSTAPLWFDLGGTVTP